MYIQFIPIANNMILFMKEVFEGAVTANPDIFIQMSPLNYSFVEHSLKYFVFSRLHINCVHDFLSVVNHNVIWIYRISYPFRIGLFN